MCEYKRQRELHGGFCIAGHWDRCRRWWGAMVVGDMWVASCGDDFLGPIAWSHVRQHIVPKS